mgnify:CR=1 FL=1
MVVLHQTPEGGWWYFRAFAYSCSCLKYLMTKNSAIPSYNHVLFFCGTISSLNSMDMYMCFSHFSRLPCPTHLPPFWLSILPSFLKHMCNYVVSHIQKNQKLKTKCRYYWWRNNSINTQSNHTRGCPINQHIGRASTIKQQYWQEIIILEVHASFYGLAVSHQHAQGMEHNK